MRRYTQAHGNFHFPTGKDISHFQKRGSFSLTFKGLNRLHALITYAGCLIPGSKNNTRYEALEHDIQAVIDKHLAYYAQEYKDAREQSKYGTRQQNYTLIDWLEILETGEKWNPQKYPRKLFNDEWEELEDSLQGYY